MFVGKMEVKLIKVRNGEEVKVVGRKYNVHAKEVDLIPFDRIMRIYAEYCVVKSECLSKPNIENRSQTRSAWDSMGLSYIQLSASL